MATTAEEVLSRSPVNVVMDAINSVEGLIQTYKLTGFTAQQIKRLGFNGALVDKLFTPPSENGFDLIDPGVSKQLALGASVGVNHLLNSPRSTPTDSSSSSSSSDNALNPHQLDAELETELRSALGALQIAKGSSDKSRQSSESTSFIPLSLDRSRRSSEATPFTPKMISAEGKSKRPSVSSPFIPLSLSRMMSGDAKSFPPLSLSRVLSGNADAVLADSTDKEKDKNKKEEATSLDNGNVSTSASGSNPINATLPNAQPVSKSWFSWSVR